MDPTRTDRILRWLRLADEVPTAGSIAERSLLGEVDDLIREAKAEAWDEGYAASERDWKFSFDITTPDEERQPLTNPYRD